MTRAPVLSGLDLTAIEGMMRFSEHFKLGLTQPYLDFVDIRLDTDVPVFLEPSAIKSLSSPWGNELSSLLQTFFEEVLSLIRSGNNDKAQRLLSSLNERNEFHLGYSANESRGHGFGSGSAKSVWGALSQSDAVKTGLLRDLEDTALLIPGIGTDMISDAVCNILRGPLIRYTQDMCLFYSVPLTPDVDSGPIWNAEAGRWETALVPLPITPYGKVILVPKLLVRQRLSYRFDEYYRHYLLPQMQQEHLSARSSLVEVLSNGRERVTKKALMEKYGRDKLAAVRETQLRPRVLDEYREFKGSNVSLPLSHEILSELEGVDPPNLESLVLEMKALAPGRNDADAYEKVIEKIFSVIFYPSLCNPKKQAVLHQGRKRVDITYSNEAKSGFFAWLSLHYCAPLIFVECKNYGKEVGNPEVDQISSRFGPSRGQVGILVCRSLDDRSLLLERCKDTAKDKRGYILVLEDKDIENLVRVYNDERDNIFESFRKQWSDLIN
ncbi:hypothetical protein [Pseudomonas cichorii]|uniref:hypothetical protein n=1 Tax=Pseudomonas cichorii TaxID=36746 RepID=UPI0021AAA629|nr:hypothetical protein [Pseudomonas cichorii]